MQQETDLIPYMHNSLPCPALQVEERREVVGIVEERESSARGGVDN